MIFVEEWPKEKTFIIQLNQNFGIEFTENHLKKSSKFRKTVLFVHESKYNVFWSDGRTNMWRKPGEEILKEMFIQRLNILVVTWCVVMRGSIRSGKSSYYQRHHEQTRLCKHSSKTSKSQYWKLGIQEHCALYHDNDPKYSSRVVRHGYLYNCPKVIKTPPQSQDLNVTENLWFKLETEIRNYSISNKEDPKKALRE